MGIPGALGVTSGFSCKAGIGVVWSDLGFQEGFAQIARFANAPALYMGQNPQNREKRVAGSKKLPFPNAPEKGDLS